MDDRDAKLLITLKNCNSLTEAAGVLNVSQPALSKRLQKIEDEFEASLVNFSNRGIHFTEAGEQVCIFCNQWMSMYNDVKSLLSKMNTGRNILNIGAPKLFSQQILPSILQKFTQAYPDIYPNVSSGVSSFIYDGMNNRNIQVAFIRGEYTVPGCERFVIGRDPLVVLSKVKLDFDQLPSYPRITYDTDITLIKQIDNWILDFYGANNLPVAMHVGDSQTAIQIVSQGTGYALVPFYLLKGWNLDDFYFSALKTKSNQVVARDTSFYFSLKQYNQSPSVKKFVDFVEDFFPRQ